MSVKVINQKEERTVLPSTNGGKLASVGIAISIIVMLGALAAVGIGVMGYYQVSPFGQLTHLHSSILVCSGAVGLTGGILLLIYILKTDVPQKESTENRLPAHSTPSGNPIPTPSQGPQKSVADKQQKLSVGDQMILRGPRLFDHVPSVATRFEALVPKFEQYCDSEVQKQKYTNENPEINYIPEDLIELPFNTRMFLRWQVLTKRINSYCYDTTRKLFCTFPQKPHSLPVGCENYTVYTEELLLTLQKGMQPFQKWAELESHQNLIEQVYWRHYSNIVRPETKQKNIIKLVSAERILSTTLDYLLREKIIHAWCKQGSFVYVKVNETDETVFDRKPEEWKTRKNLEQNSKR